MIIRKYGRSLIMSESEREFLEDLRLEQQEQM